MIIAFTGAGISKASGIPTFEDQEELRNYLDRNYARENPNKFKEIISNLNEVCNKANPNDAHYALAEYDIPIITMNIDSLHIKAGSQHVLEVHGSLRNNDVVLYGDSAPLYQEAYDWIDRLNVNDELLIIGTSFYTNFSQEILQAAKNHGCKRIIIKNDAEHLVRSAIESSKDKIEDFNSFIAREPHWISNLNIYF